MAKRNYSNRDYGDLKAVGKVKDAHALRGDLLVYVFSKEAPWVDSIEQFALLRDENSEMHFFDVEKIKERGDSVIVHAAEIKDRTEAEKWIGSLFLVPKSLFISGAGETIFLSEIQDFSIYDKEQLIGVVSDFSSNGAQDLLIVQSSAFGVVEIPFVSDFIVEINFEERKLMMELPEGLLQVNQK